ncbi:hypothetical protein IFR04_014518 [Cadophora malorum]|uniref:Uncharacterized protein n=1 Tax=Cadophora malorum TaxID=108018 RepID=A0A8H7SZC4_9HELO|nr:hypothetical protein IFR04_014518 [Cadophora malorum]
MVWAVSHDTLKGDFSKGLAIAANRKVIALKATDGTNDTTVTSYAQCKWTNCAENCPAGWSRVLRQDSGARGTEYLVNQFACDGIGVHQFCCPPSQNPTCGWYTHHNGKCDPTCPTGTVEVGSNSMYCNNYKYQAACCIVSTDLFVMKLYNQCSWADWPMCDNGTLTKREDPMDNQYRYDLVDFLEDPFCDYSPGFGDSQKRQVQNASIDGRSLVPRSSDKTYHSVEALLFLLLFTSPTQNQVSIWSDEVVAKYPNLTISKIKAWIAAKISSTFSNDDGVHQAVCNMDGLNDSLGGSSTLNCYCLTNDCCDTDDSDCQSGIDSGDDEKYVHLETKRDILYGIPDEIGDLHKAMEYWQGREYAYEARAKLEKRIGDSVENGKMNRLIARDDSTAVLMKIRKVITVLYYVNHLIIQAAMVITNDNFRAELHLVEEAHNGVIGNTQVELVRYWDIWIRDDLTEVARQARVWVVDRTLQLRNMWAVRMDANVNTVLQIISTLRSLGSDMDINVDGFS